MMSLTRQQSRALDFIRSTLAETGIAPSFREIGAAMGSKSGSQVAQVLAALVERGAIRRLPDRFRAIEVLEPAAPRPLDVTPVAAFLAPLERIDLITAGRAR